MRYLMQCSASIPSSIFSRSKSHRVYLEKYKAGHIAFIHQIYNAYAGSDQEIFYCLFSTFNLCKKVDGNISG